MTEVPTITLDTISALVYFGDVEVTDDGRTVMHGDLEGRVALYVRHDDGTFTVHDHPDHPVPSHWLVAAEVAINETADPLVRAVL